MDWIALQSISALLTIPYSSAHPTLSCQQDCKVTEERVDWTALGQPGGAAAAAQAPATAQSGGSKGRRPPAASAAAPKAPAVKQQGGSTASRQQAASAGGLRQGAGAHKAGTSRQSVSGGSKAPASRAAPAKPSPPPQPAAVAPQPAAPAAAQQVAAAAVPNGRAHHAHLQNGLSRQAAAVKQVLAAGGRPSYLTGPSLLPRR